MKRCFYWYLYELVTQEVDSRIESLFYGTFKQVSLYAEQVYGFVPNCCKCSKGVACTISHDVGIPIFDVSNMEF